MTHNTEPNTKHIQNDIYIIEHGINWHVVQYLRIEKGKKQYLLLSEGLTEQAATQRAKEL